MPERSLAGFVRAWPRRLGLLALALAVAAFGAGWALPNVAGPAFVTVRALAVPHDAAGRAAAAVIVGSGPAVRATAIDVALEVTNRYPLGVVVGFDRTPYQAAIYRRDDAGRLSRVWSASVGDPALEEGSDSPAGGPATAAATIAPGSVRHSLSGGDSGYRLVDASGAAVSSGVYYLRAWAYGIASPLVPISVDGGSDPLGPPADVPLPSETPFDFH